MGRNTFTRKSYAAAYGTHVPKGTRATGRAEEQARRTGKLKPHVDPAGYEGGRYMARPSRLRMEPHPTRDGLFELTDGTSMPVETLLDTTGSMGDNIDKALRALADAYMWCSSALPQYHLHMATATFGDIYVDQFPLCRTQFEMEAEKMVMQLTDLVANNRGGGNGGEDPEYGLFAAAYLTDLYVNKIGLKGYHFLVSDEPGRDRLDRDWMKRIFGEHLHAVLAENGLHFNESLPETPQIITDLTDRMHAFFLYAGNDRECRSYWVERYGPQRFICLPDVSLLSQVQATLIGLTEGILGLGDAEAFLLEHQVSTTNARLILDSVANIPLGVQAQAENYARRPKKGDIFRTKEDLWPLSAEELGAAEDAVTKSAAGPQWL